MNTEVKLNKRTVGGTRVISRCVFVFSNSDVFNRSKIIKTGVLVFNVRGGSFISQSQFDETTINSVVEKGSASKVQSIQLCPNDTPEISLDNYQIRFLKFSHLAEYRCLVFRFANLSEPQLEKLNFLTNSLPGVDQSEEQHVVRLMKDSSDSNMASGI